MKTISVLAILFVLASCFKKVEGADELNTNIFDKDYTGDTWFHIVGATPITNDMGLPRVRVEAVMERNKMPDLQPSFVEISCYVNAQPAIIFNAQTDEDGNFPFYFDAIPVTSQTYCLTAGIYLDEDDSVINSFSECIAL